MGDNRKNGGFTRRKRGGVFEYLDSRGRRIDDPQTLERIRALVIPPAWRDVWISPSARSHLQATGRDDAGRLQYLYHEEWRKQQDEAKFARVEAFGRALPSLREQIARDLDRKGCRRDRALACAVRLLDIGFFRIGGESYAEDNETFGLATLRREHVRVEGDTIFFDYVAKGGQRRRQRIVDPSVAGMIAALKRRRTGNELLAYKARGRWTDVRSADINDYIKLHAGLQFSAKDFRTWHATVLAAISVAIVGAEATSARGRRLVENLAVQEVAHYLGNTPAVSRSSYIDPRVFERYREGALLELKFDHIERPLQQLLRSAEEGVLALLANGNGSRPQRER